MSLQSLKLTVASLVVSNIVTAAAGGFLVAYYLVKADQAWSSTVDMQHQLKDLATRYLGLSYKAEELAQSQRQLSTDFWLRRCGAEMEMPGVALGPTPLRGMGGQ